jgi:hypothetical protein
MREHGIENFPDPTLDENGGVGFKFERGSGIDPNDEQFKKAREACEDTILGADAGVKP